MLEQQMFTGCGTAMVTPFRRDGALDEATLIRLINRQIEAGIDFLVPCGTTGESPTLSREEHLRVVELTVDVAKGKVPVLAGAGGYNTAEVIALAGELAASASTAFFPSRPTTTSRPRKVFTSTIARSRAPPPCPSFFTAWLAVLV